MMYLKRVEKQIKSVMISDDANCATAYSKMVDFFMFVDYECKTNHVTIINKLYNTKNSKYTLLGIAQTTNVSVKTLRRYRMIYAECFVFYLNSNSTSILTIREAAATKYDYK